MEGITLVA